jgi:hypothetical protein
MVSRCIADQPAQGMHYTSELLGKGIGVRGRQRRIDPRPHSPLS